MLDAPNEAGASEDGIANSILVSVRPVLNDSGVGHATPLELPVDLCRLSQEVGPQ